MLKSQIELGFISQSFACIHGRLLFINCQTSERYCFRAVKGVFTIDCVGLSTRITRLHWNNVPRNSMSAKKIVGRPMSQLHFWYWPKASCCVSVAHVHARGDAKYKCFHHLWIDETLTARAVFTQYSWKCPPQVGQGYFSSPLSNREEGEKAAMGEAEDMTDFSAGVLLWRCCKVQCLMKLSWDSTHQPYPSSHFPRV